MSARGVKTPHPGVQLAPGCSCGRTRHSPLPATTQRRRTSCITAHEVVKGSQGGFLAARTLAGFGWVSGEERKIITSEKEGEEREGGEETLFLSMWNHNRYEF